MAEIRAHSRHVDRASLSEMIIDALLGDIRYGVFQRGERLPAEKELAAQFGVSQPTIREAIRALAAMRLIEVRHGSGTYVVADVHSLLSTSLNTLLSLEDVTVLEVIDTRLILGRHIAARAAEFAEPSDHVAITHWLDQSEESSNLKEGLFAVRQFQVMVSAAAHQPLMHALDVVLVDLLIGFQLAAHGEKSGSFWRQWSSRVAEDRRRLAAHIIEGNREAASASMETYLAHQRELFTSDSTLARVGLRQAETALAELLSLARTDSDEL